MWTGISGGTPTSAMIAIFLTLVIVGVALLASGRATANSREGRLQRQRLVAQYGSYERGGDGM
jgi:hypothetical protein